MSRISHKALISLFGLSCGFQATPDILSKKMPIGADVRLRGWNPEKWICVFSGFSYCIENIRSEKGGLRHQNRNGKKLIIF